MTASVVLFVSVIIIVALHGFVFNKTEAPDTDSTPYKEETTVTADTDLTDSTEEPVTDLPGTSELPESTTVAVTESVSETTGEIVETHETDNTESLHITDEVTVPDTTGVTEKTHKTDDTTRQTEPEETPSTQEPVIIPETSSADTTRDTQTAAPETTVPATTAPSTTAPATTALSTTVPSTTAPSTAAPSTTAPATTASSVTASPEPVSGDACGDYLKWEYKDGCLKISGSFEMYSFSPGATPWNRFNDEITSVYIDDNVYTVGAYAFAYMDKLASVRVGKRVTSIGDYSFYMCSALNDIEFPYSMTYAGEGCVDGTEWYREQCEGADAPPFVQIGGALYRSDTDAWRSDEGIMETTFGLSVYAFMPDCLDADRLGTKVGNLVFPSSDIKIYSHAICNLDGTVIEFRPYSGMKSGLPSYIAPDAFYNCTNITIRCYADEEIKAWAEGQGFTYLPY